MNGFRLVMSKNKYNNSISELGKEIVELVRNKQSKTVDEILFHLKNKWGHQCGQEITAEDVKETLEFHSIHPIVFSHKFVNVNNKWQIETNIEPFH